MSLTPFQIMLSRPLSTWLVSLPLPKVLIEGMFPLKQVEVPEMKSHLVLIGKDSRSRNISAMAGYIHLPYIAIAFDPAEVKKRQERGETIIYGDAANVRLLDASERTIMAWCDNP